MVRKTLSFSKEVEMLQASLCLGGRGLQLDEASEDHANRG